jgi:isopentenyl phosphate kinase
LIILKIGGSVLTKKESGKPKVNYRNLNRIVKEISESLKQKLIIIHGAGSFGHPIVKKYGIGKKITNVKDFEIKKHGFSVTQFWVKQLNSIFCKNLIKKGINTISLQPSSFISIKNGRIFSADLHLIRIYLDMNFVPVIYGDVVVEMNESIKMGVLSGDQIIKYLAENLNPEKVILGSDVDGVFTKDPKKYSDAKLLDIVTSYDDLELIEDCETVDVTGGMVGKIRELIELSEFGVESEVLNATKPNLIKKTLKGEKVIGTIIKKGKLEGS